MVFIFSILICLSSIFLCLYWIPLLRLVSDYFIQLFICALLWFAQEFIIFFGFFDHIYDDHLLSSFSVISLSSLSLEVIIVEFFIYRRFVLPWPGGTLVIDCINLSILNYPYSFKDNDTALEGLCCVSVCFSPSQTVIWAPGIMVCC